MDRCSGKRAVDGLVLAGKSNCLVLREKTNKRVDKNTPICSRIGCSARIRSAKASQIGSMDNKMKSARPSFRATSNGKEIVGSSSRVLSGFGNTRKPSENTSRRQLSSQLDTDSSETYEHTPRHGNIEGDTLIVHRENAISGNVVLAEASSSCRGTRMSYQQRSDSSSNDHTGSFISLSSGNSEQTAQGNLSRRGLRNLRCNSVSDVVPSNSSSKRKINVFRKKNYNGDYSSSNRGVPEGRNRNTPHGISNSDSRRQRKPPTSRDNSVASFITRRSAGCHGRTGRLGVGVSPDAITQVHQPSTSADNNLSPSELSSSPSSSDSMPSSSSGRLRSMTPVNPLEVGLPRSLMNRDGISWCNMVGIAEVLLVLDRIEQDEELTYEQLISLETNLFLSGMSSLYDQHRDMRLDIDNMSYEELLALEEKMGTVSTALNEEALSRSLKRSIYQATYEAGDSWVDKNDDVKCGVCQEEFEGGDELGSLQCQHKYHVSCIQQWLRMKNWCPICKTSAESPSAESTLQQPQCS